MGSPFQLQVEASWQLEGEFKTPKLLGDLESHGQKIPVVGTVKVKCGVDGITSVTPFKDLQLISRCVVLEDEIKPNMDDGLIKEAVEWVMKELTGGKRKEISDMLSELHLDAIHTAVSSSPTFAPFKDAEVVSASTSTIDVDGQGLGLQLSVSLQHSSLDVTALANMVKEAIVAPPPPSPPAEQNAQTGHEEL